MLRIISNQTRFLKTASKILKPVAYTTLPPNSEQLDKKALEDQILNEFKQNNDFPIDFDPLGSGHFCKHPIQVEQDQANTKPEETVDEGEKFPEDFDPLGSGHFCKHPIEVAQDQANTKPVETVEEGEKFPVDFDPLGSGHFCKHPSQVAEDKKNSKELQADYVI